MRNDFKTDRPLWVHLLPWYKRPFFKIASLIQLALWFCGIDWHIKSFGGQCTPNGSCCTKKRNNYFDRLDYIFEEYPLIAIFSFSFTIVLMAIILSVFIIVVSHQLEKISGF